jgi:hypothetical protein
MPLPLLLRKLVFPCKKIVVTLLSKLFVGEPNMSEIADVGTGIVRGKH